MKFKNQADIKVGTLVVFNELPDATVFNVIERNGFAIRIVEAGRDYKPQESDVSLCHVPTAAQLTAHDGHPRIKLGEGTDARNARLNREALKQHEVKDEDGNWRPVTGMQAASYRAAGGEVRVKNN